MTYEEAFWLCEDIKPINWVAKGLTVIMDGYCPVTGTRIHFVEEKGFNGEIISGAYVFSKGGW